MSDKQKAMCIEKESVFTCFQELLILITCLCSPFRDVPADTQIEIDGDRETERIYSLFTINRSKLQKLEGTQMIIKKNYTYIQF